MDNPIVQTALYYERSVSVVFNAPRRLRSAIGEIKPKTSKLLAKIVALCAKENWSVPHYILFQCREWESYHRWARENGRDVEAVPYVNRLCGDMARRKYEGYLKYTRQSDMAKALEEQALNVLFPDRALEQLFHRELLVVKLIGNREGLSDFDAIVHEWVLRKPEFLIAYGWHILRPAIVGLRGPKSYQGEARKAAELHLARCDRLAAEIHDQPGRLPRLREMYRRCALAETSRA